MPRPRPTRLLLLFACSLAMAQPGPAEAQSLWMPRDQNHSLLLEALHPSIERSETDFPTGTIFLGGRFRLSEIAAIVVEVPYARFEGRFPFEFFSDPWSGSTIGNPYIGAELGPAGSIFFAELGARAPLTNEDEFIAAFTGLYADASRLDAFAVNSVPIHAVFNLRHVSPSGLSTRLRFGPVITIPTETYGGSLLTFETVSDETELYAVYAWQIGYEGASLRAGGAITGNALVTGESGNVGARTTNQLEVHADFGHWTIRPGVDVRLPLGSLASVVPVILGVSVGAGF